MAVSATVTCLDITRHRLYKLFHSTSLPKLNTGYGTVVVKSKLFPHSASVALS